MGSVIERGSGESFQSAFHGSGFVVVQAQRGPAGDGVVLSPATAAERGTRRPVPTQSTETKR